ncbi:GNAT family N-acetyltransferase [Vibrio sp. OCN044]|uniref:GNAT family N-acetyltransferase n=1 Tax=Vibrio tetraodonis subsp. pristinus TaxID=2695891 RepID=A0A6L8LRT5_9VIBR|nr:GNAT family N-acetyltransferase [Vibrio tetraodonis]MYM58748.1 GNAT family N-acetyltransferase [Vibrio tetraodonis subsp. pristinus]
MIRLIQAEIKHAQPISELIQALAKKYVCPTCDESFHETLLGSMTSQSIKEYIQSGYQYHIAIDPESNIIAVIGMRDSNHLYHLFVSDDYQGQGIARKLWEMAKSASLRHTRHTHFTVNSAVNAEHVYKNFGFKRIAGIRTRGGMVDVPMRLDLSENV